MATVNTITIGRTAQLNLVIYKGEPVLTFKMIDDAHARSSATATFRFNDHRQRFVEGKHFYMAPHSEAAALEPYGVVIPPRGLTLITQRGYLLLVKSFTDDLAWDVQEQLVDHYFGAEPDSLPLDTRETITSAQHFELRQQIQSTAMMYHMQDRAETALANMLRFRLDTGHLREIHINDYLPAKAMLEEAEDQSRRYLDYRIEQDDYFLNKVVCRGIPFTGTIRKHFKEKYQRQLPEHPNWQKAFFKLEESKAEVQA